MMKEIDTEEVIRTCRKRQVCDWLLAIPATVGLVLFVMWGAPRNTAFARPLWQGLVGYGLSQVAWLVHYAYWRCPKCNVRLSIAPDKECRNCGVRLASGIGVSP